MVVRNLIIIVVLTVGLWPIFLATGGFLPAMDAGDQLFPFLVETKRMLSSGVPWWSWNTFMGDNFVAEYSYYTLTNPYVWLCCLAPYGWSLAAFTASIYLKYMVLAWVVTAYLRQMGVDTLLRNVGALLFTFSSWMTCQLTYGFFIEPATVFVILLICIERFLQGDDRGWLLLVLGTFVVAFSNYYFMSGSLMCATIYFLARVGRKVWIRQTLRAAGCVVLGVMMASVVLVPTLMHVMESGREPMEAVPFNFVHRLMSLFVPLHTDGRLPIYWQSTGFNMNAAHITIFGMLPSIYVVVKNPRSWLSVLLVIFTVFYLTPLGGIFALGTSAVYSRWLYALILCQVLATMCFLADFRDRKVPWKILLAYIALAFVVYACTAGISLALDAGASLPDVTVEMGHLLVIAAMFVIGLAFLVVLCRIQTLTRRWSVVALTGICVCAALQVYGFSLSRGLGAPLNNFGDFVLLTSDRLSDQSSADFDSRTEYMYPVSFFNRTQSNSTIVHNTPGISGYNSLHNGKINRIKKRFDNSGHPVAFSPDLELPLLYTMTSVKRIRLYDADAPMPDYMPGMRHIGRYDRYEEFEFPYYAPMGFVFDKLEDIDKAWAMTDTADMRAFAERQRRHDARFAGDTRGFSAEVSLDSAGVVMYSVPADKGFKAYVDGVETPVLADSYGMALIEAGAGRHQIRFDYFPPGLKSGAILSLIAFIATVLIMVTQRKRKNMHR